MKRMSLSIILICSLLICQNLWALDLNALSSRPEEYEQFSKELQLKTDFTRVIIEAGLRIDQANPDLDFKDEKKITELVQTEVINFGKYYEKKLNIPAEKISKFQLIFKNLNKEQIIKIMKKAHLGIEFIFKKKGIGIGIAIICGMLSEYLVPIALINIGLAKFIPFSMMTPWSVIYSFVPNLIQKANIQSMLTETLGDSDKVKAFKAQEDEIYSLLKISNIDDVLLPFNEMNQEVEYLIINHVPFWKKILIKIGFKEKGITEEKILAFLEDNQARSAYVNLIAEDSKLKSTEKISLLTEYIFSSTDENLKDLFRIQFDESINKVIKQSGDWEDIWSWTIKMKKAKTLDEVLSISKEMPENVTPAQLALIWEKILLTDYIKKMELNFSSGRKFVNGFELFKTKLYLKKSADSRDELIQETFLYINKVKLGHHFKKCQNSPIKILNYLVK